MLGRYKAARTCEMKLKQNTETTLKLYQSCFRLNSIFTDMSKNMQIVKLFQAFQPIRARQLLGQCSGGGKRAGDACSGPWLALPVY